MGKTIRSFNATENVNDLINESGVAKGKLSDWINDKIEKGVLLDRHDTPKSTENLQKQDKRKFLEEVNVLI